VAQLHERALLKHGTGNDLAPNAQLHPYSSWTISKMISSTAGITMLIPNVPARSQASFVVVLWQVALDAAPIRPLSERVTWREITRDVLQAALTEDRAWWASVDHGPQHDQHEAYRHDHAEDRCTDEKDPFNHRQPHKPSLTTVRPS